MSRLSLALAAAAAVSCQQSSRIQSPKIAPTAEAQAIVPEQDMSKKDDGAAIRAQIEDARKEQTALIEDLYKHKGAAEACSNRIKQSQAEEGSSIDNLPGKILEACSGGQDDPGKCIQEKMIEAGLGEQLLMEIKQENGFLNAVLGCVPKAETAFKLMDSPAFKKERQSVLKQKRKIRRRNHGLPQSQTDWKACDGFAEKQTQKSKADEAFWNEPTQMTYRQYLSADEDKHAVKYKCSERMDSEAKNNPTISMLVKEASKNLISTESLERLKCKEFDDQFLAESAKVDRLVRAYIASPSPEARIAYLRAELAQFYRLNACIKEREANSTEPK